MGKLVHCSRCDFGFVGGHSHDLSRSDCICVSCLSRFVLPTKSRWGPDFGEVISIVRLKTAGKGKKSKETLIPTGVWFVAQKGEPLEQFGSHLVHYPIESVACPECSNHTLRLGFEKEDACPKCKEQSLSVDFIEI
jgi:hypothetical protein